MREEGEEEQALTFPAFSPPPQERHHTKVQYQLKSEHISLAQVFSKMEQVVDVLGIEDYSVSQTTLDNVRGHRGPRFPFGHPLLSEERARPALCSLQNGNAHPEFLSPPPQSLAGEGGPAPSPARGPD